MISTGILILLIIAGILGLDAYLWHRWGLQATITYTVRWLSFKIPLLPPIIAFVMGWLYCHFTMGI